MVAVNLRKSFESYRSADQNVRSLVSLGLVGRLPEVTRAIDEADEDTVRMTLQAAVGVLVGLVLGHPYVLDGETTAEKLWQEIAGLTEALWEEEARGRGFV